MRAAVVMSKQLLHVPHMLRQVLQLMFLIKKTGNKISCGAIATIQDINYIEELVNPIGNECSDSQPLTGALGRAGTYEIKLTKDGYVDWFVSNIEVSSNRCTVNGMYLQAYLDKVVVKL